MTRLFVLLLGVLVLIPTAAGARTLAVSTDGLVAGPALTADGRLVVAERARGGLRVVVIDPHGSRPRQDLMFLTAPRRADTFNDIVLTGTGGVVTATVSTLTPPDDPRLGGFLRLSRRATTLLPTIKLASCEGGYAYSDWLQAAGGAGFVATLGEDCEPLGSSAIVHTPAGARTIPSPGEQTSNLHAAGDYLAWAEVTADSSSAYSVVLARASTGRVVLRLPVTGGFGTFGADDLAVGADGTLAWLQDLPRRGCSQAVFAVSPIHPEPRLLSVPGTPCPLGWPYERRPLGLAVAGASVVYPAPPGWVVTDGRGAAHTVGELRAVSNNPGPIAFDGRTLYGINHDCDADRLIAVDAATAGTPSSSPWPVCPVTPAERRRVTVGTDLRVPITLSCPAGCHGTLRLAEERRGRQRLAARADLGGRGRMTVRVRLRRDAIGRAGCGAGLRLRATLYLDPTQFSPTQQMTSPAGVLRVRSRRGCRHLRSPAFTKPPQLLP
jgi:hypothetical protein